MFLATNLHLILVDGAKGGYDSRPRRFLVRSLPARQGHGMVDFGDAFTVNQLALECAVVGARRIACEVNAGGGALRREARVCTGIAGRDGKSARLAKRMGEKDNKSTHTCSWRMPTNVTTFEHRVGK